MDQQETENVSPQDKRKIQKLSLRIRHLDEELIQAKELFSDYESEFKLMTHKLKVKLGVEKPLDPPKANEQAAEEKAKSCNINSDHRPNPEPPPPEPNENEDLRRDVDNGSSSAPSWMRKAYKQIAMKTHPDMVSQQKDLSPYQAAEYNRLFNIAKNAVRTQDGSDIVYVAGQLGIDVDVDPETRIHLLYNRAEGIKNNILKIYKTPAWIWGESYTNLDMRKKIVSVYCKASKLDIPSADFIDQFLEELAAK